MNKGFSAKRETAGFTLIEILVVISVTAILLTIMTQIFFSSLGGDNKASAIALIKQNGTSVLDEIDKTIRGADDVVCPYLTSSTPVSSNNLVVVKNGVYTRYRFRFKDTLACGARDLDPNDQSLVNGQIVKDVIDLSNPSSTLRELTQAGVNSYINNNLCNEQDTLLSPVSLADDSNQGVSVVCGSFTRDKATGYKDVVTINFRLSPALDLDKKTFGQVSPTSFKTSVGLR